MEMVDVGFSCKLQHPCSTTRRRRGASFIIQYGRNGPLEFDAKLCTRDEQLVGCTWIPWCEQWNTEAAGQSIDIAHASGVGRSLGMVQ